MIVVVGERDDLDSRSKAKIKCCSRLKCWRRLEGPVKKGGSWWRPRVEVGCREVCEGQGGKQKKRGGKREEKKKKKEKRKQGVGEGGARERISKIHYQQTNFQITTNHNYNL